ncbi:glycosyltransferase family 2 protein (plasmid) [Tundrisphaera lichenicola]|uniref:glycosyltransferase family 2 protein n=1 Tax=Tundrisphaera lichenicola TaxID=2029860 RepID=UPI003EB8792A
MDSPRVSIGLTVYNGEEFFELTLESFLAQTYRDFELIISDNASTDRTGEIARSYAERDVRIRYHRNAKNLGLAGNHNHVVALARGEYFKWAAADDVCRPDYLARCVEVLDRDPSVVLAYPKTQFIDSEGKPLDIDDPGWDLRSPAASERLNSVISSSHWMNAVVGLVRTEALRKSRLMPSYSGGDYRVLGELSLLGKFHEIPEVLFERRIHPGSTSQHESLGMNPDPKWLVRWWTGTDSEVSLPRWSLRIDHLRTIARSGLPVRQKLSLMRTLLREVRWERRTLVRELWAGAIAHAPIKRGGVA